MDFMKDVTRALEKFGILEPRLETPPDKKFGDLSFACFSIGGAEKAKEISGKIKPVGLIKKVQAVGPYVNFFVDEQKLAEIVLKEALKKDFGSPKKKGKALVEHTSINPNASPHVGRARNALIGDAIVRLLKFAGYSVESHYFVNDIGKQMAMLVYATMDFDLNKIKFRDMLEHYRRINDAISKDPALEREVFELLNKIEKGDKKTVGLFKKIVSIGVKGQSDVLKELDIKFDKFDYESSYLDSKELQRILSKLKKWISKDESGRIVLNLEKFGLPMKTPEVALTRADGTSLYQLRDIAYTIDKIKRGKDINLVVLGEDHKLYFQQLSSALMLLGYRAPEIIHYSFILLKGEGKMSTRKGNLVLLTDFMKEAVEKAKTEIKKRHKKIKEKELEKLAKIIGYGALKYSVLKVSADKNVIFDWAEALNFEGESAPYIQYTYVRSKNILKKAKKISKSKPVFEKESGISLIKKLGEFPKVIIDALDDYGTHRLAKYAYELASVFNEFYEKCPVIQEKNKALKNSRLLLVKAYNQTIKNVLSILGIDVPGFM